MMRCGTCSQEYTTFDFVTLRNLCEHIYLDSLAQKRNSFLAGCHTIPHLESPTSFSISAAAR
jgi:hypothetical protein